MNDLQLLKVDFDKQTISARDLHEKVGSTERFSSWFERQLQYGFEENVDYVGCKTFNTLARQELQDYELSIDMAKQICMVQKNEAAKKVRQYLIDLEKAWNTPEQVMARALRIADHTINNLQNKIAEMTPKAQFFDAVADSSTAIDMGETAKVLKMGRNKLFAALRNHKVLMENNVPYQKYIDKGWFRVIECTYQNQYNEPQVVLKTLVYQKGVDGIRKVLNK